VPDPHVRGLRALQADGRAVQPPLQEHRVAGRGCGLPGCCCGHRTWQYPLLGGVTGVAQLLEHTTVHMGVRGLQEFWTGNEGYGFRLIEKK